MPMVVVDMQFKSLKDRNLLGATVNVVSKEEHTSKVERWHRVIKELGRCYYAILPFGHLPRMIVAHLMKTIVFYVIDFEWKRGVSQIIPLLTIVEDIVLDYDLQLRVMFGEHAQTFEGSDNEMTPHTVDALALVPNGNLQDGIKCFSFLSGQVLSMQWKDAKVTKMPENTILKINLWQRNNDQ